MNSNVMTGRSKKNFSSTFEENLLSASSLPVYSIVVNNTSDDRIITTMGAANNLSCMYNFILKNNFTFYLS